MLSDPLFSGSPGLEGLDQDLIVLSILIHSGPSVRQFARLVVLHFLVLPFFFLVSFDTVIVSPFAYCVNTF